MSKARDNALGEIVRLSKCLEELDEKYMSKIDYEALPLDIILDIKNSMACLYLAEENAVISHIIEKGGDI